MCRHSHGDPSTGKKPKHKELRWRVLAKSIVSVPVALEGLPPLHQAAAKGELDRVKVLVIDGGKRTPVYPTHLSANVNELCTVSQSTPLHYAIFSGNVKITKFLLDNDADPNVPDCNGCTPLLLSAINGRILDMALLLDFPGINVNAVDKKGNSVGCNAGVGKGVRAEEKKVSGLEGTQIFIERLTSSNRLSIMPSSKRSPPFLI
jgi:hypothetical protein